MCRPCQVTNYDMKGFDARRRQCYGAELPYRLVANSLGRCCLPDHVVHAFDKIQVAHAIHCNACGMK